MGKTFGLVNSFVCTGALTGPAVAGFLLQLTGYWPTWSVVLVILALDITMRPVMIENSKNNVNSTDNSYQMSITKCGILTVPQLWSMSCSLSIRIIWFSSRLLTLRLASQCELHNGLPRWGAFVRSLGRCRGILLDEFSTM